MLQFLKNASRFTFPHRAFLTWQSRRSIRNWENAGRPIPAPNAAKQRIVIDYAKRFSLSALVETGTYYGFMVFAVRNVFKTIVTIELDRQLHEMAQRKLSDWDNISLLLGDSGEVLPAVLERLSEPCLFWLDAHYSGGVTARSGVDTPVKAEIQLILDHSVPGHVILIDDARHFGGEQGYPTVTDLRDLVEAKWQGATLLVEDDIIRIHR